MNEKPNFFHQGLIIRGSYLSYLNFLHKEPKHREPVQILCIVCYGAEDGWGQMETGETRFLNRGLEIW